MPLFVLDVFDLIVIGVILGLTLGFVDHWFQKRKRNQAILDTYFETMARTKESEEQFELDSLAHLWVLRNEKFYKLYEEE